MKAGAEDTSRTQISGNAMQEKEFSISVIFRDTNEIFAVHNVTIKMTIDELKVKLELIAGIPKRLQRLMYLDEGTKVFNLRFYTAANNN